MLVFHYSYSSVALLLYLLFILGRTFPYCKFAKLFHYGVIDDVQDESGKTFQTVGLHVVQNIGRHAVQEVSKLSPMTKLAANISEYENNIRKQH